MQDTGQSCWISCPCMEDLAFVEGDEHTFGSLTLEKRLRGEICHVGSVQ